MARRLADDKDALVLFGDDEAPWLDTDWTASDDRVRGGKSKSYLDCSKDSARFHGSLDIKTLGGAGFASQRTTDDDRKWDLSDYAGIQLNIAKGDKKRYTFILKDKLLPPNEENGREQATVSYECDFDLPPESEPDATHGKTVFIPWKSFNPTYRGKVKKDAKKLDTSSIKRFSIMMRSFFGSQEGDFSLTISSIRALKKTPSTSSTPTTSIPSKDMWGVEEARPEHIRDRKYFNLRLDLAFCKADLHLHRNIVYFALGALTVAAVYHSFAAFRR